MAIRNFEPSLLPYTVSFAYIADAVRRFAGQFGLELSLVCSIIWQESAGNPWAIRFEERWHADKLLARDRSELAGYVPKNLPSLYDEKIFRAHSYGLMQILGETARVIGFSGDYLVELINVDTNLYYGCKYLRFLFDKIVAEFDSKNLRMSDNELIDEVLFRWNGSKNYPPKIKEHLNSKIWEKICCERYFRENTTNK